MRLHLWIALASTALSFASVGKAETRTVTLLDRGEANEALTLHAGYLWVGKSRLDFNPHYTIEAYGADDTMVDVASLPHSATFIYPYSATSVLVFGTGREPNLTQYSLVEMRAGHLVINTVQIPEDAWGNLWVGSVGGREYFTDMGGNQNDPARDNDPSLASQTIFSMSSGRSPHYLSTRVRMPVDGVAVGEKLFVVQREAMGDDRSNLVTVDPATGTSSAVFPTYRNQLSKALALGTGFVAVTETNTGMMHVIDAASNQVVATATGLGQARKMGLLGHCMLVADQFARSIGVVDFGDAASPRTLTVVDHIAINLPATEFRSLNNVVGDAAHGRIYARSNFPCNPLAEQCVNDTNRVVAIDGAEVARAIEACSTAQ